MIKINLATKKRSSAVQALDGGSGDTSSILDKLKGFKFGGGGGSTSTSVLAGIAIAKLRTFGVAAIAVTVTYFYFGSQKAEELKKAEAEVVTEQATQAKLNADLKKTSGYQQQKAQLEKDEKLLRTKIETIKKLTDERDTPPRILRELAEGTPKDLWFTGIEFDEEKKSILLKGKSYDEASVNSFNRTISSNTSFVGAEIKESVTERDASGTEIFAFTIEARRK